MDNERNDNYNDNNTPDKPPRFRMNLGTVLLIILAVGIFVPMIANMISGSSTGNTISYSTFKNELRNSNVATITVQEEKITGSFKRSPTTGLSTSNSSLTFTTYLPSYGDDELSKLLEQQGVRVFTKPINRNSLLAIILNLLPFLLLLFILYSFYRGSRSQGNSIFSVGQNKAKLYRKTSESTTFEDVAGVEGEGRASGDRLLSEDPGYLPQDGRENAKRGAPRRTSRNGQDAPRTCDRRRGGCAVLQHHRFRFHGALRRCRRLTCAESLPRRSETHPEHHLHRRARLDRPSPWRRARRRARRT